LLNTVGNDDFTMAPSSLLLRACPLRSISAPNHTTKQYQHSYCNCIHLTSVNNKLSHPPAREGGRVFWAFCLSDSSENRLRSCAYRHPPIWPPGPELPSSHSIAYRFLPYNMGLPFIIRICYNFVKKTDGCRRIWLRVTTVGCLSILSIQYTVQSDIR
jgi:hypothetical protein